MHKLSSLSNILLDRLAQMTCKRVYVDVPSTSTTIFSLLQACQKGHSLKIRVYKMHDALLQYIVVITIRSLVQAGISDICRYVVYNQE